MWCCEACTSWLLVRVCWRARMNLLFTMALPISTPKQIEGRDKRGHGCLVLRPRYHTPGQFDFKDMMRFTVRSTHPPPMRP